MHLSTSLHYKAHELTSCSMLVALCEDAVEILTSMNQPEGDCPLCLYPLVPEDSHSEAQPFMKLMSCFHCFHGECIVQWLTWILKQDKANCRTSSTPSSDVDEKNDLASDLRKMMGSSTGNCPVCRKVFLAKDIEHVLNLVGSHNEVSDVYEKELMEKVLKCDLETSRRQEFEAILNLQQQCGGLIEPPKNNILYSRISLQDLVMEDDEVATGEASEPQHANNIVEEEPESSSSSNQASRLACETRKQHRRGHTAAAQPTSSVPPTGSSGGRSFETRKQRQRNHTTVVEPTPSVPLTGSSTGHRRYSSTNKNVRSHSRWQPKPCPKKE